MSADVYFNEVARTLVLHELERQNMKWGLQTHSQDKWFTILGEEVGEVARAILEKTDDNYREELIQVAAVCMAALENYDRK